MNGPSRQRLMRWGHREAMRTNVTVSLRLDKRDLQVKKKRSAAQTNGVQQADVALH